MSDANKHPPLGPTFHRVQGNSFTCPEMQFPQVQGKFRITGKVKQDEGRILTTWGLQLKKVTVAVQIQNVLHSDGALRAERASQIQDEFYCIETISPCYKTRPLDCGYESSKPTSSWSLWYFELYSKEDIAAVREKSSRFSRGGRKING